MNSDALHNHILAIGSMPGFKGCALVDVENGMAWTTAGGEDLQILCEASTDFWRLYLRQSQTYATPLGEVAAQVLIHTEGRITLVRIVNTLLLVSVSDEPDRVDWNLWKRRVGALKAVALAI